MINILVKFNLILVSVIVHINEHKYASADVFTSIHHMKQLLDIEYLLLFTLDQYIIGQEEQFNLIHK